MTIDEIIDQMEEIAVYQEVEYGEKTFEMYMQVIDLLKELKDMRNLDKTNFSDGYNKAIDDFAKQVSDLSARRYMHDIYQDDIQNIKDELLK